jgi:hypothetical protein
MSIKALLLWIGKLLYDLDIGLFLGELFKLQAAFGLAGIKFSSSTFIVICKKTSQTFFFV